MADLQLSATLLNSTMADLQLSVRAPGFSSFQSTFSHKDFPMVFATLQRKCRCSCLRYSSFASAISPVGAVPSGCRNVWACTMVYNVSNIDNILLIFTGF